MTKSQVSVEWGGRSSLPCMWMCKHLCRSPTWVQVEKVYEKENKGCLPQEPLGWLCLFWVFPATFLDLSLITLSILPSTISISVVENITNFISSPIIRLASSMFCVFFFRYLIASTSNHSTQLKVHHSGALSLVHYSMISIAIFNLKIRSATSFCSFFSIASFWRRNLEILLTLSILLSDVLNSLLPKNGKIIMMTQNLSTQARC